ncbi:MAG: hypothetical protein ACLR0U_16950 [Enterocloster clostridioformis]
MNIGVECGMVMGDRFCIKCDLSGGFGNRGGAVSAFIKQEAKIGERM